MNSKRHFSISWTTTILFEGAHRSGIDLVRMAQSILEQELHARMVTQMLSAALSLTDTNMALQNAIAAVRSGATYSSGKTNKIPDWLARVQDCRQKLGCWEYNCDKKAGNVATAGDGQRPPQAATSTATATAAVPNDKHQDAEGHAEHQERVRVFAQQYDVSSEDFAHARSWGTARSGVGSEAWATRPLIDFLPKFIRERNIRSLVEVSCGHWHSGMYA
jgi:hypothetical protein